MILINGRLNWENVDLNLSDDEFEDEPNVIAAGIFFRSHMTESEEFTQSDDTDGFDVV